MSVYYNNMILYYCIIIIIIINIVENTGNIKYTYLINS